MTNVNKPDAVIEPGHLSMAAIGNSLKNNYFSTMALISVHNLTIAFGGPPVLDNVSLDIFKGQRICFSGRNGTGKSTFMRILAGSISPDRGEIITEPGVRIAYLPQDVPTDRHEAIYEIVAEGLGKNGALLAKLHRADIGHLPAAEIDALNHQMNDADCWNAKTQIDKVLSLAMLDGSMNFTTLSGGMRRKVFLARALVADPDLLLLDEPTNHLDIESISWLESFILSSKLTVVFVTHDRRLLKALATRIVELDRGAIADWACDYTTFLDRKQALLAAEGREWGRFDKKLAQEEAWIRRGIKARRTRNEGRARALLRLREERKRRRERSGTIQMEISEAARSGSRVIEAHAVSFAYDAAPVVNKFGTVVMRGDRIGVIGPNGCGKTTLLKLLLGDFSPQSGTITTGTNVRPIFFDQLRNLLDSEKTVWANVAPGGGDTVFINGSPKHVISYLQDFLFTSDRAKSPVKQLSGGERNRLLLARLFARESNLLVLDEPTNDLDTETLELLEELLDTYNGTAIIVSHDREFLNNTVTSIIAFEEKGIFKEYIGGFDDWERQTTAYGAGKIAGAVKPVPKAHSVKNQTSSKRSYREQQEFATLPVRIEQMEHELSELIGKMGNPECYRKEGFIREAKLQCQTLEKSIAAAYQRWEELDSRDS